MEEIIMASLPNKELNRLIKAVWLDLGQCESV